LQTLLPHFLISTKVMIVVLSFFNTSSDTRMLLLMTPLAKLPQKITLSVALES